MQYTLIKPLFPVFLVAVFVSCNNETSRTNEASKDISSAVAAKQGIPAADADIIGTWLFPGTEDPPMEMVFGSDHSLVFNKGYEYLNPATWSYDGSNLELILTIQKMPEDMVTNLEETWVGQFGFDKFERDQKRLHIRFTKDTKTIYFSGYCYDKR